MKTSSFTLAAALFCGLTFPNHSQAGLVAYWNFDEGAGSTAGDSSGNSRDGTLGFNGTGAAPAWDSNARFGNSLEFNTPVPTAGSGTNGSLVTVPFDSAFRLNDSFTISLWWRPDSDYASGFPGAIRIGSQGATTGTNIGWGFFHNSTETPVFKRGNVQPPILNPTVAMTVGDWHHILITHDATTGNNIVTQDGSFRTYNQTWLDATTSANLEIGRMDSFVNAGLDDIAIYDNAITLGQARSLYTVATDLALDYSQAEISQLWDIHAGGTGASGIVDGTFWAFSDSLPGTPNEGDAYLDGGARYVALSATSGLVAIPEPGSIALVALTSLLFLRRSRNR
jgi:hypothetical protein